MNDRNIDQLLDAWMDLGPSVAPARVAEAARLEARSTRQTATRLWWPPRRFPEMNNTAKLALGAAAVMVAALIGFGILGGTGNIGGPDVGTDEPTPGASADADADEALVRAWVDAVNRGDRDSLVQMTADRVATADRGDLSPEDVASYVLGEWCPITVNDVERVGDAFLISATFRDNADSSCTSGAPGTSGQFVIEVRDGKVSRIP